MIDPEDLKDAAAASSAMADQAFAAMTEPARAMTLFAICAAVTELHEDLAGVLGSREQAATAVLGALQHVVIMNMRGLDNSDAT